MTIAERAVGGLWGGNAGHGRALTVRVFHTLPGEDRTSMEVYARELRQRLARLGEGLAFEDVRPAGRLRAAAGGRGPLARLAGYADRYAVYQWRVRGQQADVNHIVDHGYGHLAFSLDPRRTVVTFHDAMLLLLEARELPTTSLPRFTILGHKLSLRAMRGVARLIAVSYATRGDLLRFTACRPEQVRVIPQGVSERFRPPDARAPGGPNDPPRVLHVGHTGPYKNIEGLLRALPRIQRRLGAPVRFVKVGGAFTADQRALIARLGLSNHVEHRGAVPLAELPAVYADADVLLQPSLYEGFGLTVLEAMACGTPVVAANTGALPEVVGDAGLLVPPTDPDGIAEAVVRAVSDQQLRAHLRHRGIERARGYPWERTARETLAVYREIAEENG